MIFWRIIDSERAAKNAMEMLKINEDNEDARQKNIAHSDQIKAASHDIATLRLTVLR